KPREAATSLVFVTMGRLPSCAIRQLFCFSPGTLACELQGSCTRHVGARDEGGYRCGVHFARVAGWRLWHNRPPLFPLPYLPPSLFRRYRSNDSTSGHLSHGTLPAGAPG